MQRNGSATSSTPATSLPAKSIPAQLSMFDPPILPDTRNAISSPVSAVGPWRCEPQGGRTISPHGLDHARASRSAGQVSGPASTTSGISGRFGSGSSASAHLQQSLENRLRARLNGSRLCEVIWKPWATPWGQSLLRPRARVRSIFATDIGLWPTPAARDWRSESASDEFYAKWAACTKGKTLPMTVALAVWSTPMAVDGKRGLTTRPQDTGLPLPQMMGMALGGFPAQTVRRARLAPEFPSWLMGYPATHLSCAATEMPSTYGLPRK